MKRFDRAALDRRTLLRGAGASVALPWLAAMQPALAAEKPTVRRFVAICGGLGFHAPFLFPDKPGRDYELTPYLAKLAKHRSELTLFSGLSHPEQNGNNGHASSLTWLTSARRPGLAGFKNTISLDQVMAAKLGGATRFPFLTLAISGGSLSWTPNGINIPSQSSPAKLYKSLFVDGSEQEIEQQMRELRRGRSILDTVRGDARSLERKLDAADRDKLDEYFSAIRGLGNADGTVRSLDAKTEAEGGIRPTARRRRSQ